MNKAQYFLRKHSPTILTVTGAVGVVATSVLAVRATPKALLLIEEAENEKGDKLTVIETIKVAWKPYIPAVISGVSTITCIFSANYLNEKTQASLMSAYALLNSSYQEYRTHVNELYGDEADTKVLQEISRNNHDEEVKMEEDKLLFFDFHSLRHFYSTMEDVLRAENEFLDVLNCRGYACLNEYYDMLGIDRIDDGYRLGWYAAETIDPYGCEELEFGYEETTLSNGEKCWIIDTNLLPTSEYIF